MSSRSADGDGGPSRKARVRAPMPPKARDARMDRAGSSTKDPHWLFVMVPTDASMPVERIQVAGSQLRRWRRAAALLTVVLVVLLVAVAFAWPRSRAYGSLVQENLELKQRLEAIDRKMSEVDRIMLRLRLYDAQLESLGAPLGDHGPIPADAWSNAAINTAEGEGPPRDEGDGLSEGDEGDPAEGGEEWADRGEHPEEWAGEEDDEQWVEPGSAQPGDFEGDGLTEEGVRPAESWAEGIESRADGFLDVFAKTEPNLNLLVEELESLESLERSLPSLWPTSGYLSSGYGWRRNPFGVRLKHHSGVDIAGARGSAIRAAADGTVIRAGWLGGYGQGVEITHGYGVTTLYGHCSELYVHPGDYVQRGEKISAMGSTGRSTGPHLHFEVRLDNHPVDPLQYLRVPASARRPSRNRVATPPVEDEGTEGDELHTD